MESSLHFLAVLGIAAALRLSLRSAALALRRGAEAYFAREVAGTRARRGDVTGMEEAGAEAARARRERRRSLAALALWLALLAFPAWLLPSPAPVYAAYVVLWLVPASGAGGRARRAEGRS